MSVIPATYNLPDHYKGSTLSPVSIVFNFDITGANILAQIKKSETDTVVIHAWQTGLNITVVDPLIGSIVLNQVNTFSANTGNYHYDLQVNFANGTNFTYLKGTLKIHQDVSRI